MDRRRLLLLVLALLALAPHAYKLTLSIPELYDGFIADDAFYYYKTAFNIRDGLGSTFDGINTTNGYHPLWMGVCVLLSSVVRDPTTFVFAILGVNVLCIALLLSRMFSMFGSRLGLGGTFVLAALVAGNYVSSYATTCGLETGLYAWLALTAIDRLARARPDRLRDHVLLGSGFALAFLARTEFLLLAPVYLLYLVRWVRTCPDALPLTLLARNVAVTVGIVVAVATPYLAWNVSLTGYPQQLSGLVEDLTLKGGLTSPEAAVAATSTMVRTLALSLSPLALHAGEIHPAAPAVPTIIVLGLLTLALLGASSRRLRRGVRGIATDPLLPLTLFGATVLAHYFVNHGAEIRPWTLTVPILTVQVLAVRALRALWDELGERRLLRTALGTAAAVFVIGCLTQVWFYRGAFARAGSRGAPVALHLRATEWLRDNVEDGELVGVWNAGYVGYFSGKQVMNLDGFINGPLFYEYLADGRGVWRFAQDAGIDYVADYFFGPPSVESSPLAGRLERVYTDVATLTSPDAEAEEVGYYVWRVKDAVDPPTAMRSAVAGGRRR